MPYCICCLCIARQKCGGPERSLQSNPQVCILSFFGLPWKCVALITSHSKQTSVHLQHSSKKKIKIFFKHEVLIKVVSSADRSLLSDLWNQTAEVSWLVWDFFCFILVASLVARSIRCATKAFCIVCSRTFNHEKSLGRLFNI